MILRFGCENYRSIAAYQEVLMTAMSSKVEPNHNIFECPAARAEVLPITAIYGANGSGKTNMIMALRFFVQSVLYTKKRGFSEVNAPIFRLDSSYKEVETTFDIDFVMNEKHYHYGYAIKDNLVISEWLYSFSYANRKSRTVLFHRDIGNEESEYYFNKPFKGNNKAISELVSEDQLFISVAAASKHELCKEIVGYFESSYKFRFSNSRNEENIAKQIKKHKLEDEISRFLSAIDVGASQLKVIEVEVDSEMHLLRSNFADAIVGVFSNEKNDDALQSLRNELATNSEHKILVTRKGSDGELIEFSFGNESLGTRALVSLLVSVFLVLKEGGVFVVDELESSLHTLLSLKVVELFNCKSINKHGAQLIFTTHETQLLNFEGFRKDEIWLTEKCLDGSTSIAPLSDYSIPKRSNVRNGYLDGRFGAVPFLGLIDSFEKMWGCDGTED